MTLSRDEVRKPIILAIIGFIFYVITENNDARILAALTIGVAFGRLFSITNHAFWMKKETPDAPEN